MRRLLTKYDIPMLERAIKQLKEQQGPTIKIEIVSNEGNIEPVERFIDRLKYHNVPRIEPKKK